MATKRILSDAAAVAVPGDGWEQVGTGPKGGKRWKKKGDKTVMNTENQMVPTSGPTDKLTAVCCFIGCGKPATKLIYQEPITYDNYTHSCDDHVEDLKSSDDDVVETLATVGQHY